MSDDHRGRPEMPVSAMAPFDGMALWVFACGLWASAPAGVDLARVASNSIALILALWLAADLAPRAVRRATEAAGRLRAGRPTVAGCAIVGGLLLGCAALWLAASQGRAVLIVEAAVLLAQGAAGSLGGRRPRLARAIGAGTLMWGAWVLGSVALGGAALARWSWPLVAVGAWAGLGLAAAEGDSAWLQRTASALMVVGLLALRQPLVAAFVLAQALASEAWRRVPVHEHNSPWPTVSWAGVIGLVALASPPTLALVATWLP